MQKLGFRALDTTVQQNIHQFQWVKSSRNRRYCSFYEDIYDWIVNKIATFPVIIHNKQELEQQLTKNLELFCYCNGIDIQKGSFYALSKSLTVTNFCVIQNSQLLPELGLKERNITLFKNGSLQDRIQFEYQNRYQSWELFLKIYAINHIKKSEELIRKRFSQESKNIDTTIAICDFSFKCQKFWLSFLKMSKLFQQRNPNKPIAMSFIDQKQVMLYNLIFHTVLNLTQLPAFLNIKILSQNNKAGWFRKYIAYPQKIEQETIKTFLEDIDNGKIKELFLSGQIPQKNGFTGKNSEKLIQKVVAKNLNQTIAKSQKHYLLMLNSLSIGIKSAQEFYKEFKKAASFLKDQDITFGFMDIMENQIQIEQVSGLPQVLLFNKFFKENPIVMGGRDSFDSIMRFLENNAIINYTSESQHRDQL